MQLDHRLAALMDTAKRQRWLAQALYKSHLETRLRYKKNVASPGNMVFVEATLVNQPHKLTPDASGLFPGVAADTHTNTIQRFNKSSEKISCQRIAEMFRPHEHKVLAISFVLYDYYCILGLLARYHLHTVNSHGFAVKQAVRAANLEASTF